MSFEANDKDASAALDTFLSQSAALDDSLFIRVNLTDDRFGAPAQQQLRQLGIEVEIPPESSGAIGGSGLTHCYDSSQEFQDLMRAEKGQRVLPNVIFTRDK